MAIRTGNEICRDIMDSVNVMGTGKEFTESFLKELSTSHPTLIQGMFRNIIKPLIIHMNERHKQGQFDMRDEASVKLCHKMVDEFIDTQFPLI